MTRWTRGLLVGLAVGVAAGAVTGVLLAPEKGVRTRRQLVRRGERWGHKAADAVEAAGEMIDRGRRTLAS